MKGYRASLFGLFLTCSTLRAGEQIATVQPSTNSAGAGEVVQVDVKYTTANPQDTTLTGVGLRLHWNGALLKYQNLPSLLADNLVSQGDPELDSADFDSDPDTDRFIHLAWADIDSNWPNLGAAPVTLFSAEFLTQSGAIGSSPLNITKSSTAVGYDFLDAPSSIAVDCTGVYIEIQSRTFLTGEAITCSSSGDMVFGPYVEQQISSTVHLIANTGIAIRGPLKIESGAIFTASHGGP